ncbi:transposase [Candidatus Roizmanbacteria bacterium]|nr:transposase [Candidatus Roizmanbacteria bacterium]
MYRHVSKKYLQAYADEFAWRCKYRSVGNRIFYTLLK